MTPPDLRIFTKMEFREVDVTLSYQDGTPVNECILILVPVLHVESTAIQDGHPTPGRTALGRNSD